MNLNLQVQNEQGMYELYLVVNQQNFYFHHKVIGKKA